MFQNYFKIAVRNILKQKMFTFINVTGLAVGMACAVLIFLWINEETSYDQFLDNKDNVYRVVVNFTSSSQASICGAFGSAIKEEIPEITESARIWSGWESQIYYGEKFTKGQGRFADPSLFSVLTFPFVAGDTKTALDEGHSVVISKSMSQKLFGRENSVGEVVQIKNRYGEKEDFKITGVFADIPQNSHVQFDFLFSFNLLKTWYRPDWAERWSNYSFITYFLADKNASTDLLTLKINECFDRHKESDVVLRAEPLSEVYLNPDVYNLLGPSGNGTYVKIFFLISILLVLVASINYMNLSVAKSIRRSKEVGLRKVIGAKKRELIFQSMGESVLLALITIPLIFITIEAAMPIFNSITGKSIEINYLNQNFILGVLVLVLLTGFISGIYPAFYLSSFSPTDILKNKNASLGRNSQLRKVLVIFQFSLSLIIITSALVVSNQMNFIQHKDLGFEKENILYGWVPGSNNEVLKSELLKNPNILSVGTSGAQLDWLGWSQGINKWEGKTDDESRSFGVLEVGYDYLDTYKMEIANGRYYSRDYSADEQNSIIINEAAVEAMNIENPVGKTLTFAGQEKTIIGVVKNFHFSSLHEKIGPMLLTLYPKKLGCLAISVSGKNIDETIAYIDQVFEANILDDKVEVKFLDEQLGQQYQNEKSRGTLFFAFSVVTIFIAVLGLFGLTAFSLEQRKKEVGIRKVIGASAFNIITEHTKQYLVWILISNIIAFPITYYFMQKWLENFAYRIDIGLWEFSFSGACVLLVALFTVGFQTIKAANANPVESLRNE